MLHVVGLLEYKLVDGIGLGLVLQWAEQSGTHCARIPEDCHVAAVGN